MRGTAGNLASGELTPSDDHAISDEHVIVGIGIQIFQRLRAGGWLRGHKRTDSAGPGAGRPGREGHKQ